jgi:glycosyltransferase involved in cell wall biosynthesis
MPHTVPFSRYAPKATKLTLVIPVYNEEKNLEPLLRILGEIHWPLRMEFLFVDDCSVDRSVEILEGLTTTYPEIRVIKKSRNEGKGSAVARGIAEASGEIIAIQDADLEYDPRDLLHLIQPIINNRADVVYGSRFRRDGHQVHRTYHRWINVFLTHVSNWCSGISLTDMESCYKVFRADVLKRFRLQTKRFGFEPEITAYVAKFPLRLQEFPVSYFPRTYLQGKKIGWKDGIAALWHIFRFNFLVSATECLLPERHEEPSQILKTGGK